MRKLFLVLGLSALTFLGACGGNSDADVQKKVGDKIHTEPNLKTVSVTVKDGNVSLAGEVDSQTQQKLAESMARQIDNVKNVDNKIIIKSGGMPPMPTAPASTMTDTNSTTMNSNMSNMSNK